MKGMPAMSTASAVNTNDHYCYDYNSTVSGLRITALTTTALL